jgi:hypothetical protein
MINPRILLAAAYVLGSIGGALILSALVGGLRSGRGSLEAIDRSIRGTDRTAEQDWPFIARVARSFFSIFPRRESNQSLEERIRRAGYPFNSVAHFYTAQLSFTFLFGVAGLLAGLLVSLFGIDLPAPVVLTFGILMAYIGSSLPADEIKDELERRKREMVIDMTMGGLSRLNIAMMSQTSLLQAMGDYVDRQKVIADLESAEGPEWEKARQRLREAKGDIELAAGNAAATLKGFGGNLFADMINRLAAYLAEGAKPARAAQMVSDQYPYIDELSRFLVIVETGLETGADFVQSFEQFNLELRSNFRARQRELGQRAVTLAKLGQGLMFLPMLLLLMAPLFLQALALLR